MTNLKYGYLAGKLGANPILPRPFLIGVRGWNYQTNATHPLIIAPKYDDSFCLLMPNGEDEILFFGASHSYQFNSKASTDTNHDGIGDVATINFGTYLMTDLTGSQKYPVFSITLPNGNGNIPCLRDIHHTGNPDTPSTADQILFHWGYNAAADSIHKSSIGCQTTDLPNLITMHTKAKNYGGKIDYVLTSAENVLSIFDTMPVEFKI